MERIEKLYNDPETGLMGRDAFLKRLSKEDREIAQEFFEQSDAYQKNRPVVTKFRTRRIEVSGPKVQVQADLADMTLYARENDGVKYLLCAIDCFSRYAWVYPLKTKRADEIAPVIEKLLKEVPFKHFQTDNGTEFYNATVKKVFEKYDVNFFSTVGSNTKAAIAERFIRTLKLILARLWDSTSNFRYLEKLDSIVKGYNNRVHSSLGVTPTEAMKATGDKLEDIREHLYPPLPPPSKPKYKEGDTVMIALEQPKLGAKEQKQRWSEEVFTIARVRNTNPVTYDLVDYNKEPVLGAFYEHEIQKTKPKETYRVEKVLRRRTRNGIKEVFVKWLGYPDSANSWIPESDLQGE